MKIRFSLSWLKSKQRRKQRKFRYNAPKHIRHKLIAAHLSKDLRTKYKRRSFPLRIKDRVKVLTGQFKGKIGEIEHVDLKNYKVHVKDVGFKKTEGPKTPYPLHPSNLQILSLDLDDKRRKEAIERNVTKKPSK
jgi:large subunit ribosomal protein L24